jgi:site-specific recombinase XerD
MVQKQGNWRWLLEGFKYELEAQVRPKTVEYYHDHVRIFVRWVENTGITEARSLTKRDVHSFFHHIITNSHRAKRNHGAGEEARHAESLRFHYYRGLKRFFSWLKTEGYIEYNPLDGMVFKPPKEPPSSLTSRSTGISSLLFSTTTGKLPKHRVRKCWRPELIEQHCK